MSGIAFLPLQCLLIAIDLVVSDQRYSFNLGATNDSKFLFSIVDLIFYLGMAQSGQEAYQEADASNGPFEG